MRSAIRFGLLALVLQAAVAQTRPDVAEILKKVAETYKAVSQYEFVVDLTLHDKEGGPPSATRMVFAFKAPNQYRMQGAIPGMSAGNPDVGEMLIVHAGSAVRFYFPKLARLGNLWVTDGLSGVQLNEETVEPAAGGVEGSLLVFRGVVDQRSAVLVDGIADELFGGDLSQGRVLVQVADDLSAENPEVIDVPLNGFPG